MQETAPIRLPVWHGVDMPASMFFVVLTVLGTETDVVGMPILINTTHMANIVNNDPTIITSGVPTTGQIWPRGNS